MENDKKTKIEKKNTEIKNKYLKKIIDINNKKNKQSELNNDAPK